MMRICYAVRLRRPEFGDRIVDKKGERFQGERHPGLVVSCSIHLRDVFVFTKTFRLITLDLHISYGRMCAK